MECDEFTYNQVLDNSISLGCVFDGLRDYHILTLPLNLHRIGRALVTQTGLLQVYD